MWSVVGCLVQLVVVVSRVPLHSALARGFFWQPKSNGIGSANSDYATEIRQLDDVRLGPPRCPFWWGEATLDLPSAGFSGVCGQETLTRRPQAPVFTRFSLLRSLRSLALCGEALSPD